MLARGKIVFGLEKGRSAIGKVADGRILDITTFEPSDGISLNTKSSAAS
jgi:hypothetical protein